MKSQASHSHFLAKKPTATGRMNRALIQQRSTHAKARGTQEGRLNSSASQDEWADSHVTGEASSVARCLHNNQGRRKMPKDDTDNSMALSSHYGGACQRSSGSVNDGRGGGQELMDRRKKLTYNQSQAFPPRRIESAAGQWMQKFDNRILIERLYSRDQVPKLSKINSRKNQI